MWPEMTAPKGWAGSPVAPNCFRPAETLKNQANVSRRFDTFKINRSDAFYVHGVATVVRLMVAGPALAAPRGRPTSTG